MAVLAGVWGALRSHGRVAPDVGGVVEAINLSYPTQAEEEDNVHVALKASPDQPIQSFAIEARQPTYEIGADHAQPGRFAAAAPAHPFDGPGMFILYDDGKTRIQAVRQASFWRPAAMTVRVGGVTMPNIHFLQLYRQIPGTDSRPQILVLYTDGNLRLKPLPQPGRHDQLFGTSVLIGPADDSKRPVADIARVEYEPKLDTLQLTYRSGEAARITIETVSCQATRIRVSVGYRCPTFARIRSMFVADGNSDVDRIRWHDAQGTLRTKPILAFTAAAQATDFLFMRQVRSLHNTSAPDLWLGDFILAKRQ
ncbi:MAG: hypothetical protein ACM359_09010 [Bacillota bacterium]